MATALCVLSALLCRRLICAVYADRIISTQGEIMTNHEAEVVLWDAAADVVFVRCSYFMENWVTAVESVKQAGFFYTTPTPLNHSLPMVSLPLLVDCRNLSP